jgi:hypothetical protein
MSLNSLKIATDGYLKRQAKAVLVIAVSGYLGYSNVPPPVYRSGGGHDVIYGQPIKDEWAERKNRILAEDSEIIAIIEIMLKTTAI